ASARTNGGRARGRGRRRAAGPGRRAQRSCAAIRRRALRRAPRQLRRLPAHAETGQPDPRGPDDAAGAAAGWHRRGTAVMMAAAPAAAPAPPVSRQPQRTGPDRGRDGWRRWRLPAALIGLIIAAAALIALLQPAQPAIGYLDPADTGPYGTHALADILAGRGTTVVAAATPAAAKAAAAQSAATIVITSPEYLSRSQLAALATAGRDVVIVEPDAAALAALAPRAAIAGAVPIATAAPVCGLTAAILAGNADMGGTSLRLRPGTAGAASCYRVDGLPSLVQYASAGRIITILGTGAPLTNSYLARHGNAALALNLLGAEPRAVWLV